MKKAMIEGYVEAVLGPKPELKEDFETPFKDKSPDEQAEIMYEIESLSDERAVLTKTIKTSEKERAKLPAWTIKMVGGRLTRVLTPEKSADQETYQEQSVLESKKRLQEIKDRSRELGQIPGVHEEHERKMHIAYYLIKALRHAEQLKLRKAEIETQIEDIQRRAAGTKIGAVAGVDAKQISLLQKELNSIYEDLEEFEHYEAGNLLDRFATIREYAKIVSRKGIVEIPTVEQIVESGLENMRNHQPFLLVGHLGSGKTEIARHMAKLFMIENGVGYDPAKETDLDAVYDRLNVEIFSGGEEASVYDLVGKLKLTGRARQDELELKKRMSELGESLERAGVKNIPEEELAKLILGKADVTETVFNYGPFGRALREGRPIIIDEVNLIPPEVIGRINDVLLRGIGDTVHLQENGEEPITIKPGFAIIGTCNLGRQYAGIKEVNAAFKSRWVAKEADYPTIEETYDLILASLVRRDRVRLPPGFPLENFDDLARLAVAVREIQELFTGQTEGQRFMALSTGVSAEKAQLEKAVVSTRDLMRKIIIPWRLKNFSVPLDGIIVEKILAAEVFSMDDQKFMTEIFLRRGFFKGWDEKKFRKAGIKSVTQREIDALQAALETDAYKDADKAFGELLAGASERAGALKTELLVGNIELMKRLEEKKKEHSKSAA